MSEYKKILFADDQIPDEDIPFDDIKTVLKQRHPEWGAGFINAFPEMRLAVKTLESTGYEVDIANKSEEAFSLINDNQYDIAIVDLGWFADDKIPESEKDEYGWKICKAINKVDEDRGTSTPQIMFSNRFYRKPEISVAAADRRILPIFKNYEESGNKALMASVKFIENLMKTSSPLDVLVDEFKAHRAILVQQGKANLEHYYLWSKRTYYVMVAGVVVILIGVIYGMFWNQQLTGFLTAVTGILTNLISKLFLDQLNKMRTTAENFTKDMSAKYDKSVEKIEKFLPVGRAV